MSPRRPSKMVAGVARDLPVPLWAQTIPASMFEGRLGDMVVYFVDCPQLYDREGMYGFGDDDARSVYFSRAVLEMLPALQFSPDVIQIHNLAAQGVFGFVALTLAGLDKWGLIRVGIPGLDNVVNVLGRGIHFADVVNTVSERYAAEI